MTIGVVIIVLFVLAIISAICNKRFLALINSWLDVILGILGVILLIGVILFISNIIMPEVYVDLSGIVNPIIEFLKSVWNFRIF